jgi:hypothetical protein
MKVKFVYFIAYVTVMHIKTTQHMLRGLLDTLAYMPAVTSLVQGAEL